MPKARHSIGGHVAAHHPVHVARLERLIDEAAAFTEIVAPFRDEVCQE
jgi:hypothetical protein